jgi:hypothetical protein
VNDPPCLECAKVSCCDQVTSCLQSVPCTCAFNCILMGGDPLQCQADCLANDPASNALITCGQQFCLQQCL